MQCQRLFYYIEVFFVIVYIFRCYILLLFLFILELTKITVNIPKIDPKIIPAPNEGIEPVNYLILKHEFHTVCKL